jgi:putative sporulation protein YyaC
VARRLAKKAAGEGRLVVDASGLCSFFGRIAAAYPNREALVMLCIGTDRSTGDAYGPLLGTALSEQGWPGVIGTMEAPCDAVRLSTDAASIPMEAVVIAFDACLGKEDDIGLFAIADGPLTPAAATGGKHGPVGHYSIAAVVGRKSVKPLWELQSASLRQVMDMVRMTAQAVQEAWEATDRRNDQLQNS